MPSSNSLPQSSQTQPSTKNEEQQQQQQQQQQPVNPMIKIILENLEYEKILLPSLAESIKFNPIKLNNYQKQTYLFNIINNINTVEEKNEDIRVWVLALYTIVKMNIKPSSILYCPFLINFIQLLNKLTELIENFKIEGKEINNNWFIKERSLLLFLSDRGSEFDKWSVASSIRRLQSQNNQFNHIKSLSEINSLRNPLLEKFKQLPSEVQNNEEEENLIELPGPSEILNGELNFLDYNLPIYNISWDSSIGEYEEAIPTDAIISNWNLLYTEPSSDRKTEVFLAELYKPTAQNRLIPYLTQNPLTYDQLVGFCKFNFLLAVEYCKLSQKHSFNLNIESLITSQPTISSPLLNLILELTTQNFIKFSESYLKKFLLNCKDQAKSTKDREEISEINRFVDSLLASDWLLEQFCGDKGSLEKFISSVGY